MEALREHSAERIEQSATELFAERGFDAVGVRDIARMAHVPVSAINYYFGSKAELYRECARKLVREYLQEARGHITEGASMRDVVTHFSEFAARNPRLVKMWLDFQMSGDADARAYANREIMAPVWQLLVEHMSSEGEASLERRTSLLSFIGAVVLDTVLSAEQVAILTQAPESEAREVWVEERLQAFGESSPPLQKMRAAG